jgi:hypothetical protein
MKEDVMTEVLQSVITYVRENHAEEIDKAYEYFWEEEYPEDFLTGTALDIAFVNFEDWLICDYKTQEGNTFIDLYIKQKEDLSEDKLHILEAMKTSVISIYEVISANTALRLKDLLLNEEIHMGKNIIGKLNQGDIFATRVLKLGNEYTIGRCIYPYSQRFKDTLLGYVDKQFNRYVKNKNPEGTMKEFLKDEAYLFNTIWINNLFKLSRKA